MRKQQRKKNVNASVTREAFVSCISCAEQSNIILRHTTHEWKVNSTLAMQGTLSPIFQYLKSRETKRDDYIQMRKYFCTRCNFWWKLTAYKQAFNKLQNQESVNKNYYQHQSISFAWANADLQNINHSHAEGRHYSLLGSRKAGRGKSGIITKPPLLTSVWGRGNKEPPW